ncbi:MAG TPA: response regulator transcription factor [Candidatus Sulfotelmatobacter sp.]|jgi:DNA-binding NarL/FixJ family response regulator|nr:response regulator transcription factor [Candidatus Sulfotelmatobacter sp.]
MKNSEKIRILIADDHYVVRIGLNALISVESDMQVVAEAADGAQALELFVRHRPDLALLDMRMPVKDGVQTATEIRSQFPDARIIMLTAFEGDENIHKALQAGARGYVFKNSSVEKLIPALRAVLAGGNWIPQEVASRLASRKSFEKLTDREVQVLRELAKGLANKEIAESLTISEHTVKTHLKNILGKLRVADRTEAVTTAIQRGIIQI